MPPESRSMELRPLFSLRHSLWGAISGFNYGWLPIRAGGSGPVSITTGSTVAGLVGVQAYRLIGALPTVSDTDSAGITAGSSIAISGLTIPADGIALVGGTHGNQAGGCAWTNATEIYDANQTAFRASGAIVTTTGTPTVILQGTAGSLTCWSALLGNHRKLLAAPI